MPTHAIRIDRSKRLSEEPRTGHNRWHPDIPPAVRVDPGDTVVLETRDALDGAITPATTVADLHRVDLNLVHPLTGPVFVNGAEPGDLLEVHIVDITPQPFGFTVIVPGFGFLREYFTTPFLVKWSIDGTSAVSPDLPGVRIPAGAFMGVMGVAPSQCLPDAHGGARGRAVAPWWRCHAATGAGGSARDRTDSQRGLAYYPAA